MMTESDKSPPTSSILGPVGRQFKRLTAWVLNWAHTPYALPALFLLALAESSFFPVPPDVLLISLAISIPSRAFLYALICSVGSVLGGVIGWLIGRSFYDAVGIHIVSILHLSDQFETVRLKFAASAFHAIFLSAFTPIPYKVFTIASGLCHIPLPTLIGASVLGRSLRFFLLAGLIHQYGSHIKAGLDKYFDWVCLAFALLLLGGFLALKLL